MRERILVNATGSRQSIIQMTGVASASSANDSLNLDESDAFPPVDPDVPRRLCFVTVGATAPFHELISAVLAGAFLRKLRATGFTDLLIQHGKDGEAIMDAAAAVQKTHQGLRHGEGLRIAGFAFREDGLKEEFKNAKGGTKKFTEEGLVVSHAGSGSIMEGLRMDVPMVVVPNPSLLDNHQVDLADELSRQGYVVHGKLGATDFETVIVKSELLKKKQKRWPPVNSGDGPGKQGRLAGVLDEETGFTNLDGMPPV